MNIGIIGYGRMGRAVETAAEIAGHKVVSIIEPSNPGKYYDAIDEKSTGNCDVLIDFSVPDAVVENIRRASELEKPMVLGTTGWYDKMESVKKTVENGNSGLIWSGNFSQGVQIFFALLKNAAGIIDHFEDYDICIHEYHHTGKKDSPSGTAHMLGNIIIDNVGRKTGIVTSDFNREIGPSELGISSSRCGSIPGTHTITIDSPVDTIELKHTARGSSGFAKGSVAAAEWILNRKGFFGIEDLMQSILKGENR